MEKKVNIEEKIKRIRESALFDEAWYMSTYPDVKKLNMDPVRHYLMLGTVLLRDPNPKFSTQAYLNDHVDVRESKENPLWHYLVFGKSQNRKIKPSSIPDSGSNNNNASIESLIKEDGEVIRLLKEKNKDLQEENELLLLQLHQIQEELELLYIESQKLKKNH